MILIIIFTLLNFTHVITFASHNSHIGGSIYIPLLYTKQLRMKPQIFQLTQLVNIRSET